MVGCTEQSFRRVTNAELDGKITVPNGGDVRGPADDGNLRSVTRVGLHFGSRIDYVRLCPIGRCGSAGGLPCWCGRAGLAWRGQGGGQPGEQDVEAAFEFGGAVVGGQGGG